MSIRSGVFAPRNEFKNWKKEHLVIQNKKINYGKTNLSRL